MWVRRPKRESHGEPGLWGRRSRWSCRNRWEVTVTREEKERAADGVLTRYEHLGTTVVSDDQALCRLLQTLDFSGADRDVGEHLCAFLVA